MVLFSSFQAELRAYLSVFSVHSILGVQQKDGKDSHANTNTHEPHTRTPSKCSQMRKMRRKRGKKSIKCCAMRTTTRTERNTSAEPRPTKREKKPNRIAAPTTKPKFRTWKKRHAKNTRYESKGRSFFVFNRSEMVFRLCAQ